MTQGRLAGWLVAAALVAGALKPLRALSRQITVAPLAVGGASRAVAVLARGDLTYATGNVLLIDGGLTIPRL